MGKITWIIIKFNFVFREGNSIARHINNVVNRPDQVLEPLRGIFTNREINNFPETFGNINTMPGIYPCVSSFVFAEQY